MSVVKTNPSGKVEVTRLCIFAIWIEWWFYELHHVSMISASLTDIAHCIHYYQSDMNDVIKMKAKQNLERDDLKRVWKNADFMHFLSLFDNDNNVVESILYIFFALMYTAKRNSFKIIDSCKWSKCSNVYCFDLKMLDWIEIYLNE